MGGGAGLGRQYALDLGAAGARVAVVSRSENARLVAREIEDAGGTAVAIVRDAREGDAIVAGTLQSFGGLDAMVVNAGITRDRSFARMSDDDWAEVIDVHLGGAHACSRAVWGHFLNRGGGSLVLTTSGAGLHGSFGQANYSAAKAAIIGLTFALAKEGERKNIRVNAIAPMASTAMTADVFSDELRASLKVEDVSPFVLALLHPACPSNGTVVEAGGGWAAAMRWQRSEGLRLERPDLPSVLSRWPELQDFARGSDFPSNTGHSLSAAAAGKRTTHTAQEVVR